MMDKLRWYKHRLSCMSIAEINYRFHTLVINKIIPDKTTAIYQTPAHSESQIKAWLIAPTKSKTLEPCMVWADEIITGNFHLLGSQLCEAGSDPNWNSDPRAKKADSADIKYVWELNRHLQWTALAQAYCCSKDEKYLSVLLQQMDSWLEQCPVNSLPNWKSGLEIAIRLINWSAVYVLLEVKQGLLFAGANGEQRKQRFLKAVYLQTCAIQREYSLYSSANNHLIGEAAGVYIAAQTWPFWPQMTEWKQTARQILITEIQQQVTTDGVVREQAVSYQLFLLEFFFIVAQVADIANDDSFPNEYWQRLEAMLDFVAAIRSESGHIPMIGDADDAAVLKLSGFDNSATLNTWFALGAIKFNRADFIATRLDKPDALKWWLGEHAEQQLQQIEPNSRTQKLFFPEGGYAVFKSCIPKEVLLLADIGELGYLSIAAHGHADALSVWLSVAGRDFLVDAGTYSYHRSRFWRNYFRSTAAHNTVSIDGVSQSEIGGAFLWLHKARTTIEHYEQSTEKIYLLASHDGYRRLNNPVTHKREITFYPDQQRFMVTDTLETTGEHLIEQRWQFTPECQLKLLDNVVEVVNQGVTIYLKWLSKNGKIQILKGSTEPIGGWFSNAYDQKMPAPQLVYSTMNSGVAVINCEILCNESRPPITEAFHG